MRETRPSGSMSGRWKRLTPRHLSTLRVMSRMFHAAIITEYFANLWSVRLVTRSDDGYVSAAITTWVETTDKRSVGREFADAASC